MQVERDFLRSLVQPPAQDLLSKTSVMSDFLQKAVMLLGFNSLYWCISAVLRVLIFLLACDTGAILPRVLAGLHQHICILEYVRGKDG